MAIKVLIVDDSAMMRHLLKEIIGSQPDLEVVGAAPDPYVAREQIKRLNPDVLTLDVEMPRMDGLEFLEKLMRLRPMPVVMISSLTAAGSEATLRALELGAVDFVTKPRLDIASELQNYTDEIADKIRAAALAKLRRATVPARAAGAAVNFSTSDKILCIGASTGGTEALKDVLMRLPPNAPGIAIAQHMPAGFTRSFAKRLDGLCAITVKEAAGGERLLPGHAYIAPGNHHLKIKRSGANYMTELSDADPVNRHRPSVDVLFHSAAQCAGANALGLILTGMGKDGARGLLAMRQAGSFTAAQDEQSCVVYGMPREAVEIGAVDVIMPLDEIADQLMLKLRELVKTVRI